MRRRIKLINPTILHIIDGIGSKDVSIYRINPKSIKEPALGWDKSLPGNC